MRPQMRVRLLRDQIGVVISGREHVLIAGDVVEANEAEVANMTGTVSARGELVTDLEGEVAPCTSCGRLWRRPEGLSARSTCCGDCSKSTAHRLRIIHAS